MIGIPRNKRAKRIYIYVFETEKYRSDVGGVPQLKDWRDLKNVVQHLHIYTTLLILCGIFMEFGQRMKQPVVFFQEKKC